MPIEKHKTASNYQVADWRMLNSVLFRSSSGHLVHHDRDLELMPKRYRLEQQHQLEVITQHHSKNKKYNNFFFLGIDFQKTKKYLLQSKFTQCPFSKCNCFPFLFFFLLRSSYSQWNRSPTHQRISSPVFWFPFTGAAVPSGTRLPGLTVARQRQ